MQSAGVFCWDLAAPSWGIYTTAGASVVTLAIDGLLVHYAVLWTFVHRGLTLLMGREWSLAVRTESWHILLLSGLSTSMVWYLLWGVPGRYSR